MSKDWSTHLRSSIHCSRMEGRSDIQNKKAPFHLGLLWGGNLKIDQSKNRSMWAELCPYMGIQSIFLSCSAHCHIQMYGNGWRRANNSIMFISEERKIINLLESFWTNIQWKWLLQFLRGDRRAFLSSSNIAKLCPTDSMEERMAGHMMCHLQLCTLHVQSASVSLENERLLHSFQGFVW